LREEATSNMKGYNELAKRVTYARELVTLRRAVGNM
jgi:hypothetical protein